MSLGPEVSVTVGAVGGQTGALQEQPQGLKFPTPGVALLFGLHFASTVAHGGTSAIQ